MEKLEGQRTTATHNEATMALQRSAYADITPQKIQEKNADSTQSIPNSNEKETHRNDCENGFPIPGGFPSSRQGLSEKTDALKQSGSFSRRTGRIEEAIMTLAHLADTKCSGLLSKEDLEHFKDSDGLNSSARELTQHLIDKFERFAQFSDIDENADPIARQIAKEILHEDRSNNKFISAVDLKNMRSLNPLSLSFVILAAREHSFARLKEESEATQLRSLQGISNILEKKLKEREQLLSWQ